MAKPPAHWYTRRRPRDCPTEVLATVTEPLRLDLPDAVAWAWAEGWNAAVQRHEVELRAALRAEGFDVDANNP